LLTYRTVEEAVERVSATRFGLSGSVWGTDRYQATAVDAEARLWDGVRSTTTSLSTPRCSSGV
jgi:acyl-CoA reductase-like NAD-dependent aldehyde dehydrogenase